MRGLVVLLVLLVLLLVSVAIPVLQHGGGDTSAPAVPTALGYDTRFSSRTPFLANDIPLRCVDLSPHND